jgi:hypothetical protein
MAMSTAASAIAAKQLEQRNALWPGQDPHLWDRKANKGFATIPKTMPLILKIIADRKAEGRQCNIRSHFLAMGRP